MKLPFSQQVNGKPTHFIEKIWSGLIKLDSELYEDYLHPDGFPSEMPWPPSTYKNFNPKITTIRRDLKNRWKPKALINFIINFRENRTFQFAPVLPVISTQKFELKYHDNTFLVYIDDKLFFFGNKDFSINEFENYEGMMQLVHNDGFDSIEDFCNYFSENYVGKIIHWTDLKY